jgi:hypothetical protein
MEQQGANLGGHLTVTVMDYSTYAFQLKKNKMSFSNHPFAISGNSGTSNTVNCSSHWGMKLPYTKLLY